MEEHPFEDKPVYVVIPASGCGLRCKVDPPKQFQEAGGRPIISHTIKAFESVPFIKTIIVTTPQSDEWTAIMKDIVKRLEHKKVVLTKGDYSRHRSIFAGLKHLKIILERENHCIETNYDPVVLIHDGVRPFVDKESISAVARAAMEHQVAGVVRPLVSTVLALDENDFLESSLDRSTHWASEMPQGFRFKIIYKAFEKCSDFELDNGTECLKLAADHGGVKAKLIHGNESLWKVTSGRDMLLAQQLLGKGSDECQVKGVLQAYNMNPLLLAFVTDSMKTAKKTKVQQECIVTRSCPEPEMTTVYPMSGVSFNRAKAIFDGGWLPRATVADLKGGAVHLINHSLNCVFVFCASDCKDCCDRLFHPFFESRARTPPRMLRTFVLLVCPNATKPIDQLHSSGLREYVRLTSKKLLTCGIVLHALTVEDNHDDDAMISCLRKLLETPNAEFAGQSFSF